MPSLPYWGPSKLVRMALGNVMSRRRRFLRVFRPNTLPAMLLRMFGMLSFSKSSAG